MNLKTRELASRGADSSTPHGHPGGQDAWQRLGQLQYDDHQDDDHEHADNRADQSSVHGPLPSDVLTSGSVEPAPWSELGPQSYPSLQRKAHWTEEFACGISSSGCWAPFAGSARLATPPAAREAAGTGRFRFPRQRIAGRYWRHRYDNNRAMLSMGQLSCHRACEELLDAGRDAVPATAHDDQFGVQDVG